MSIVLLSRVTLCGMTAEKESILAELQQMGCMHLIPLQAASSQEDTLSADQVEEARVAVRYLMDVPHKRLQELELDEFDLNSVVEAALTNRQHRREAEDRRLFLVKRIQNLAPWGNFTLPEQDELAGYRLWFYRVPHPKKKQLLSLDLPWEVVAQDNRFVYVVVVAREEPPPETLPVARTRAGAVSLQELKHQLRQVEIKLQDLDAEHEALSRWIYLISKHLAEVEDQDTLTQASHQTLDQDGVFAVQGWMPQREVQQLEVFAWQHGLALVATPPDPEEEPPTLLENPPDLQGGQDLVSFYQTPGYHNWDPSLVVFYSFALFFAMILADAGYTALLIIPLLTNWQRLGRSEGGIRTRTLAAWILGASLVYGVMVGSYFGINPIPEFGAPLPEGPARLLARLWVLDLNDYSTMMKLSVGIGCLHLALANGAMAYQIGRFPANGRPLGWVALIVGGYFLWLSLDAGGWTLRSLAIALMGLGFVLLLFFGSERKVDSLKSALLRLVDGVTNLTRVSKMFGDILSYLRLFALGLATGSLAVTFNGLARQVEEALPGLGLLLAIVILLFGHGINLSLAIISGFVHGLRLNFIEFYGWGISDEGYPFRAFARRKVDTVAEETNP